jgi:hypothetical protein
VSVASGAAVATGVPFTTARLKRARLAFEHRQERFAELRDAIDATSEPLADIVDLARGAIRPDTANDVFGTLDVRGRAKKLAAG